MKDEALAEVRTFDLSASAENVKTKVARVKLQLTLSCMLLELPTVIKEAEKQIEHNKQKVEAFRKSQEGDSL